MTLEEFKSTLNTYGKDKILGIVFDNMRVWSLVVPKRDTSSLSYKPLRDDDGNIQFYTFDELVTIDEANSSLVMREEQKGTSARGRELVQWDIVTHIENIQGMRFIPKEITDPKRIQFIKENWDATID